MSPLADELMERLHRCDLPGALAVTAALIDDGATSTELIAVLSAAQRAVGERWQRNEWTVAQEHAVTAVTDRVLAAVASALPEVSVHPPVAVVCGEGDWHSLAPRMLTDGLRTLGWDARFLGGSIPAPHLVAHLRDEDPIALAMSCSIPMFLLDAVNTVRAGHEAGIPVLAGGRAFGTGPGRARVLGADGWAPTAEAAGEILHRWAREGAGPLAGPDVDRVAAAQDLRDRRAAVLVRAEGELVDRLEGFATASPVDVTRTREDLAYLAAFIEATLLTGDVTLLADYLVWLTEVLVSRTVPATVLGPAVEAFTAALTAQEQHEAAVLLRAAARSAQIPDA